MRLVRESSESSPRGEARIEGDGLEATAREATSESDEIPGPFETPEMPTDPDVDDTGVFSDLDARVRLDFSDRLGDARKVAVGLEGDEPRFVYVDGRAVGLAPASMTPAIDVESFDGTDRDGDGIPDQLDLLMGAKKAVLNGADYRGGYEDIDYPGGDVARDHGVCTDVVVRSLRNAGLDLQKRLHEDIETHPEAYPMVDTPDPNIDHRRVRTILPYFERHWTSLSTERPSDGRSWLPGDVVFMDTMDGPAPDHVGIVSNRESADGRPLIVNNWTYGYETSEMNLLGRVPVTHRFRLPRRASPFPPRHRGLEGLLRRRDVELPAETEQVVAVTAPSWGTSRGRLRRYARRDGRWRRIGDVVDVRLGREGFAWGRGLHDPELVETSSVGYKREGDLQSTAGVFELGSAFGSPGARPDDLEWPWRRADTEARFVDDPDSTHYNRWVDLGASSVERDWDSAERMAIYELGLVVEHNRAPTKPEYGSALFLHTFRASDGATLGCTAMPEPELAALLGWLDPDADPVLVQFPGWIVDRASDAR